MNTLFDNKVQNEEKTFERQVRPQTFSDFIGQDLVKNNLSLSVRASIKRGEVLDHIILYGPPGLGKTTLANIVANEVQSEIRITSGAIIQKASDILPTLAKLEEGQVLFIDEIHRVPKSVQECLYTAMEDFAIDIINEDKTTLRIPLKKFTLVGATTRAGMISAPLRARFGIAENVELYTVKDLTLIAKRTARVLGIPIDDKSAEAIAKGSRGTPRVVNRIIRRCRDVAEIEGDGKINMTVVKYTFGLLRMDSNGLEETDRKVLDTIINVYKGGPVGISAIAAAVGEDQETLETINEPFLIQCGYIERTPRGRKVTPKGYKLFSKKGA